MLVAIGSTVGRFDIRFLSPCTGTSVRVRITDNGLFAVYEYEYSNPILLPVAGERHRQMGCFWGYLYCTIF